MAAAAWAAGWAPRFKRTRANVIEWVDPDGRAHADLPLDIWPGYIERARVVPAERDTQPLPPLYPTRLLSPPPIDEESLARRLLSIFRR